MPDFKSGAFSRSATPPQGYYRAKAWFLCLFKVILARGDQNAASGVLAWS